ncbi:MAG: sensor histidine kinase [Pseudonocardiaceae bacterium]
MRWVLEQYRSQGARKLVNKARSAAAQLLTPPDTAPRSVPPRESAPRANREDGSHDVLAGMCAGVALRDLNQVDSLLVAALAVVDFAADDLSRLLAELLDNATSHSPPTSKVTVSAHLTEQGSVLLRIEDAGIGLPAERLQVLNARLSATPRLDSESIEHMGLAVVRRLAARHGIRVRLDKRATHGTTAAVLLPADLVCEAPATPWFADPRFADQPTRQIPRPTLAPVRVQASPPPSPRLSSEWIEPGATAPYPEDDTKRFAPARPPAPARSLVVSGWVRPPLWVRCPRSSRSTPKRG